MKKVVRILVPAVLLLVILASCLWYLFVFDREFTRDILLQQARSFSTNGNQSIASWFYDMAYEFSAKDDDVAIELANQFKAEGNYTKAEYTLSNAIADGGTVDLYVALCKTYVEQDKLLDAVTMLDNIADPTLKAELNALRPAAPVSDPEPGFYSQYITISLNAESGTIYYTTDGEYPSIDKIPYSDAFTLPAGETMVYAVTVAENGLVSPLMVMGYTVGGVIEEVTFEDAAIESSIRSLLGADDSETIFTNQLWTITEFTLPEDATSLNDVSKLAYLESLTIQNTKLDSLSCLTSLNHLTELDLTGCRFSAENLEILATLPMLQKLTLSNCGLSTLAGLENAHNLTEIDLSNNTIRNLDPLSELTKLTKVDLQHNAVTDLKALSGLTELETLDVCYNSVQSISPLSSCTKLTYLCAHNNKISNLSGIESMSALTYLHASNNKLSSADPAAKCLNLTELYVASNALTNISGLASLVNLETLDFSYNSVAQLPAFPDGAALRTIDGSYNELTSLDSLKNQSHLSLVYMDYNQITSIAQLKNCKGLLMVCVYGNAVTDAETLIANDVIVNYDPTAAEVN